MGMFDYFYVEDVNMLPVSDEQKSNLIDCSFQTKDFKCDLTKVKLCKDGRVCIFKSYNSEEISHYLDYPEYEVEFYGDGKDNIFYQFVAYFEFGKLQKILFFKDGEWV